MQKAAIPGARGRGPAVGIGRTRAACLESRGLSRALRVSHGPCGRDADTDDGWLVSDGPGVAVRFINRPDATPLTTIMEQKSIATLRSIKSLAAVAHSMPSKHAIHYADGAEQKQPNGHASRRQAALTIDEATLRELHEIIDNQVPVSTECVNDVEDPTRPISPPHSPLVRALTPRGLPSWPGDLPALFGAPRRRISRARSFGNALRDFFRGSRHGKFVLGTRKHGAWTGNFTLTRTDVVPRWCAHV